MEELIKTFHIDYKLVIAQLVNFVVVLFVFKKFAYAPLLRILNDRTAKIEKGLIEAKEAGEKLLSADAEKKEIIKEARLEAQEIISRAEKSATVLKAEIIEESKKNAERLMSQASNSIAQEKEKIVSEIKSEISELVVLGMEKLFEEKGKKSDFEEKALKRLVSEN